MPSGKASKRLRKETMKNVPSLPNSHGQPMLQTREYREIYAGPLPEPDTLVRYKNADPSFPERIMKMAEAHNAADIITKNRISLSNMVIPIIGQIFTLILGAGGILACVFLAKAGYTGAAIAAIVGSFAPIIISALKTLQRK